MSIRRLPGARWLGLSVAVALVAFVLGARMSSVTSVGHPDWVPASTLPSSAPVTVTANVATGTQDQVLATVDTGSWTVLDVTINNGTTNLAGNLRVDWKDTDGTLVLSEPKGYWPLGGAAGNGFSMPVRAPRAEIVFTGDGSPGSAGTVIVRFVLRSGTWTSWRPLPPQRLAILPLLTLASSQSSEQRIMASSGWVRVAAQLTAGTAGGLEVQVRTATGGNLFAWRVGASGTGPTVFDVFHPGGWLILDFVNVSGASITFMGDVLEV